MIRIAAIMVGLAVMACSGRIDYANEEPAGRLGNRELQKFKETAAGLQQTRYVLPAGRYIVTETLFLASNTELSGDGPKTVLEAAPRFKGSRFITNTDFDRGNINIRLHSLTVIFNSEKLSGALPGVLRFESVQFLELSRIEIQADTPYFAIDLAAGIVNAEVTQCRIQNQGKGGGIQVRNRSSSRECRKIRIAENTVAAVNDEPIAVFGWLGRVADVTIDRNTVAAQQASFGISAYGIDQAAHNGSLEQVVIRANDVTGGRLGAITAKGGVRDVRIERNRIRYSGHDGIFIDNGGTGLPAVREITVRNNSVDDSGRHGMYVSGSGVLVEGNAIHRSRQAGIYVSGSGGRVDVIDNRIAKAKRSILISGPSTGRLAGNVMEPHDLLHVME